jgi:hypothetical protein
LSVPQGKSTLKRQRVAALQRGRCNESSQSFAFSEIVLARILTGTLERL